MSVWNNIALIWQSTSPKALAKGNKVSYSNKMLLTQQTYLEKETKMKYFSENTKTFKLFNALLNGEAVTPAYALHRYNIKNITAEVSRIRQGGYAVYANRRVAGNGVKTTEYVLGKPSRALVAAGYRALAMGI